MFLISFAGHSQIIERYTSTDSDYFPTTLYFLKDSSFLYQEVMEGNHPDNKYFERGTYLIKGDTLHLVIENVGFNCNQLIAEPSEKISCYSRFVIWNPYHRICDPIIKAD